MNASAVQPMTPGCEIYGQIRRQKVKCAKCGSENVIVTREQVSAKTKTNHVGPLQRLGRAILVICTCGLWLLVPRRKTNSKTKVKNVTVCVCQFCGYSRQVK